MDKNKNYTEQIVDYVKKNIRKGYSKDTLHVALLNQGHSKMEIDKAFKRAEEEMIRDAPRLKTKPEIKYERVSDSSSSENVEFQVEKKSFWKKFFG